MFPLLRIFFLIMIRTIIIVVVLLIVGFIGWKILMTAPPQDLPQAQLGNTNSEQTTSTSSAVSGEINRTASTVTFTGYGPGKEHPASFEWTEDLRVVNGVLAGTATFNTASVKTDSAGLDRHLCSDDFFNCAVNKTVVFTITNATPTMVTGTLTFAGKTHTVSFPVSFSDSTRTLSADFRLDRTPFNFKYTLANTAAVDKEIRVTLKLVLE